MQTEHERLQRKRLWTSILFRLLLLCECCDGVFDYLLDITVPVDRAPALARN